ncbi:PatB family C-S lyase [Suttonella sp. R2A3]|uniref:MalY/PatB family protein n=1 Tax=Suttonella sp. R2A3 TaxID=2908648 RepID=UPI001F3CFB60|nr:PatB family C-S lyase [Suttonella sp. R2A3]UJF24851.1 PatB family C-S lyase [Suttonella sp. R2A3]
MIQSVDRKGSDSVKWAKYAEQDIIPMWIADTDYRAPEAVLNALHQRIDHGVLGYGMATDAFIDAVVDHCQALYNWTIDRSWVVPIPGVVPGLNMSRAVSLARGKSAALTISPTYPHLRKNPSLMNFRQQFVDAVDADDHWAIDFSALDRAVDKDSGLLLLCHPHNPLGKTYSVDELVAFADFAKRHDLLVCSDEIHCDLVIDGSKHTPFATLNADTLARTITLMAPSKTYNIAGLACAFAIIADPALRTSFRTSCAGLAGDVNILGMTAATAALNEGEAWHQAMIAHFRDNAERVYEAINAMKHLRMKPMTATYLAWIDARELPVEHPQRFFEQAGVGLADGADYGSPGFLRLNFGCSRELLDVALQRMAKAIASV